MCFILLNNFSNIRKESFRNETTDPGDLRLTKTRVLLE